MTLDVGPREENDPPMGRRGGGGICVGTACVLGLALLTGAGPASAAVATFEVTDAVLLPAAPDLTTGLARVQVVLTLSSDTAIPDVIGVDVDWPSNVVARPLDDAPWAREGETAPFRMDWGVLSRIDGTSTDGRWQAVTHVSPGWTGTWLLDGVRDPSVTPIDDRAFVDVSGLGATVVVGDPATGPRWSMTNASEPVRVVTGQEYWLERVRVTDRDSGAGISAFVDPSTSQFGPAGRLPAGSDLLRASPDGYLTLGQRPVVSGSQSAEVSAYGGRATRGFSLEAMACTAPVVKWQANQRAAVSGRTVTVTGNAWPAPAILAAANDVVRLQQLVGRTWRTVAVGNVRYNGRYTMIWNAPTSGSQLLRVYKPGGVNDTGRGQICGSSVGSTLAATSVVTL